MFGTSVLLSRYSNYKIGGPAQFFFEATNVAELFGALETWRARGTYRNAKSCPPQYGGIFILGSGTNVLFPDEEFHGLVLKPSVRFVEYDGSRVRVGAGMLAGELLDACAKKRLSGLEWAGGLPGTVGGAIRGNAGAFGGEMKDSILEVTSIDLAAPKPRLVRRSRKECAFGYRSSIFKELAGREVIVDALVEFSPGSSRAIRAAAEEKVTYRNTRHPMEYPNIGSIFKNVDVAAVPKELRAGFSEVIKPDPMPVVPAAYLLSEVGLKGVSCGGAMISPKHPNFIVNALHASAKDVKELIALAKSEVQKKFGIALEEEVLVCA